MFKKATETINRERHNHSIIQEGMTVKGDIQTNGDVRLDGRLEGKLVSTERVTIGATGVLVADIEAAEVVVMGSVEGNICAHARTELRKGARVIGNVRTAALIIEEGVHFHGNSNMEPDAGLVPSLGVLPGGKGDVVRDEIKDASLDAIFPR